MDDGQKLLRKFEQGILFSKLIREIESLIEINEQQEKLIQTLDYLKKTQEAIGLGLILQSMEAVSGVEKVRRAESIALLKELYPLPEDQK